MKHKLVYTKRAGKDIERLDEATKNRIGKTLLRYAEDPLKNAEKLIDPRLGTYRFRTGEFRVRPTCHTEVRTKAEAFAEAGAL